MRIWLHDPVSLDNPRLGTPTSRFNPTARIPVGAAEAAQRLNTVTPALCLGALGGTLNGDPCSLLGVIWVLPGYIGVYKAYIRVI